MSSYGDIDYSAAVGDARTKDIHKHEIAAPGTDRIPTPRRTTSSLASPSPVLEASAPLIETIAFPT